MARVKGQKRKSKCPYLPRRPKRPVTGFNLFFRHYYFSFCKNPRERWERRTELMRRAGRAWRRSPETRRIYNATAKATVAKCSEDRRQWNSMKKKLKKPATAYQLFYKEFIKKNGSKLPFPQWSRQAGLSWNQLEAGRKEAYIQRFQRNWTSYCRMWEVLEGGGRIENFMGTEMNDEA